VKVTLQRALMFNNTTHRAATIQRIRIGAGKDGRITAIGHESWSGNLGSRPETATAPTRLLYAGAQPHDAPARRPPRPARGERDARSGRDARHDGARNRDGRDGREAGLDPVAFRILNDTQVDPESPDKPFSKRQLVECLRTGAATLRLGAAQRRPGAAATGAGWSAWASPRPSAARP
jgi:xanthine dehydrogenase YagR molybdenum-binding subunit